MRGLVVAVLASVVGTAAAEPAKPPEAKPLPASAAPADIDATYANPHTQRGTTDLGVALGLFVADGVHDVAATVSAGRFVADQLALAASVTASTTRADGRTATLWAGLAEPSYHLELDTKTFGVLGMAVGAAYQSELGTSLAIAPRVGLEIVLGEHHVIAPMLAYQYIAYSAREARDDAALTALTSTLRFQLGYSVRW